MHISQVLRSHGVWVDVVKIKDPQDISTILNGASKNNPTRVGQTPVSHVVVAAPWIFTPLLSDLCSKWPDVHFSVVCHSNVAFLGADPMAVRLLRQGMDLQKQTHNFAVGGNSRKFCEWVKRAYGSTLTYLPNLYNLKDAATSRPLYRGGVLRLGSFGAMRMLKNHQTAAAAALEIARRLGVDMEFWMNAGRNEGGGNAPRTIRELFDGTYGAKLVELDWASWPDFRKAIRHTHLLLQPSFTESFNMVTADGVAEGVPSVTSEAIEWVPDDWKADADSALSIANKGIGLLNDPISADEGREALTSHNDSGVNAWMNFLLHK